MTLNGLVSRPTVAPALALALACVGFALAGPLGLLAALLVAASAALPWPLPFALGQLAAAAIFTDPGTAAPPTVFLAVQSGLWLALVLAYASGTPTASDAGMPERVRETVQTNVVPVAVGGGVAIGLLAVVTVWSAGSLLAKAGFVAIAIAAVLYGVHRYERVTTGLVAE